MTQAQHPPIDPKDIITARRIGAAITALADPGHSPTDPSFRLDETEREAIRQAAMESHHPLTGCAYSILDQWDDLEADDRAAGLLLFAQIVDTPGRDRSLQDRRVTRRGMEP